MAAPPISKSAAQAALDAHTKYGSIEGDSQFEEILHDLTKAGHVIAGSLINRWDGMSWVRA